MDQILLYQWCGLAKVSTEGCGNRQSHSGLVARPLHVDGFHRNSLQELCKSTDPVGSV